MPEGEMTPHTVMPNLFRHPIGQVDDLLSVIT